MVLSDVRPLESYSVRGVKVNVYDLGGGIGYYEVLEPDLDPGLTRALVDGGKAREAKGRGGRGAGSAGGQRGSGLGFFAGERWHCSRPALLPLRLHPRLPLPLRPSAHLRPKRARSPRELLALISEWALRSPMPLGTEGSEESLVMRAAEEMGIEEEVMPHLKVLSYYVWRDLLADGKLSIPLRDPGIEEVALEHYGRPLSVVHRRHPDLGWMDTNLRFDDEAEVRSLVRRLAHSAGREVSVAFPYLDAVTPSGDRISLTYSSEVSVPGSSFSIRRFPERPFSMRDLVYRGALSPLMAAYYSVMVEAKAVMVFLGAMSTGKTTLMGAVTSLVPENQKVATIEDVPELNLARRRWQRFVARGSRLGLGREVSLVDLLLLSLRYRPDYVVLGEARGVEVQAFIQAAALGHGAMTTFHAESPAAAVARLSSPPLSVDSSGISLISVFSLMAKVGTGGRGGEEGYRGPSSAAPLAQARRNVGVWEQGADGELNPVFQWAGGGEGLYFYPSDPEEVWERSERLRSSASYRGLSKAEVLKELQRRADQFGGA